MALLHPMKLSIYMVLGVPNFFKKLIGDQDGDRASMHDVVQAVFFTPRSAVSSGSSVNYYSMAPAYEHRLTRRPLHLAGRFTSFSTI